MTPQSCMVVVLGTAQDGGVPQLGCHCQNCLRAISSSKYKLTVSSLGIINPNSGNNFLIDATPNIIEQLGSFHDSILQSINSSGQHKMNMKKTLAWLTGVFLTHAHMGHYLGLVHFGKESCNTQAVPIMATASMCNFLSTNHPFNDLMNNRNIVLENIIPGKVCLKESGLSITPIKVQHRQEHSDTIGFIIKGVKKRLLYMPDIDSLTDDVIDLISQVDIALIDGTFFDKTEISTGREYSDIPHPLIKDSMHLLERLLEKTDIVFTHFNHTNPVVNPMSDAVAELKNKSFEIAQAGQLMTL